MGSGDTLELAIVKCVHDTSVGQPRHGETRDISERVVMPQARGQRLACFGEKCLCLMRAASLGYIAQHDRIDLVGLDSEMRDGRLGGKFLAILPATKYLATLSHPPGADIGLSEFPHVCRVRGAIPLGNQDL